MSEYAIVAAAGTMRSAAVDAVRFEHRWTDEGVTVEAAFTGAHLLHLAVAACVLNDVYREAARGGIPIAGVRVTASGAFDEATWRSTGIGYAVDVDSSASRPVIEALLDAVDAVAEIPRAIRMGATVERGRH